MWHLSVVSKTGQHDGACMWEMQNKIFFPQKVGNMLLTFYYSRLHRAMEDDRKMEKSINF